MKTKLIGISYSPWTQQARWALRHHGIPHAYREHLIMLGLPQLRLQTRRWRGRVTVPALVGKDLCLLNTDAIVRWADQQGSGPSLFPVEHDPVQRIWRQKAETILEAARRLVTHATLSSPAALREALPPALRSLPGGLPMARLGARYLLHQYPVAGDSETWVNTIASHFKTFREQRGDKTYFFGELSMIDIMMATTFQAVLPPADRFLKLEPTQRQAWTRTELVDEFKELAKWRDHIFERHMETI